MSKGDAADLLVLSNLQAKALAGKVWTFHGVTYRFQSLDPAQPGQPPWRSGAEGKAFPLLDQHGAVVAYLKFFNQASARRLERTCWLIAQELHTWLPALAAAPRLWADTRLKGAGRPAGIDFDFGGCLSQAISGESWLEVKQGLTTATSPLAWTLERRRC